MVRSNLIFNLNSLVIVTRIFCSEILGISSDHVDLTTNANEQSRYKQILNSRAVQLVAFFCWVYVGVEVTIGGEALSFIRQSMLLTLLYIGWIVTVCTQKLSTEGQVTYITCSSSSKNVAEVHLPDTSLGNSTYSH